VVHDSVRSGQNDVTELTGWEEVHNPLFDFIGLNIEARADDTALVDAPIELNDDLSSSVIINDLFKIYKQWPKHLPVSQNIFNTQFSTQNMAKQLGPRHTTTNLKFANVFVLHHHLKELDDNL
jgi:hypothetical protein